MLAKSIEAPAAGVEFFALLFGTFALLPAGAKPLAIPGVFGGNFGTGTPPEYKSVCGSFAAPWLWGRVRPPQPPQDGFSYARSPMLIRLMNVGVSPSPRNVPFS